MNEEQEKMIESGIIQGIKEMIEEMMKPFNHRLQMIEEWQKTQQKRASIQMNENALEKSMEEKITKGIEKMRGKYDEMKKNVKTGYERSKKKSEDLQKEIDEMKQTMRILTERMETIGKNQQSSEHQTEMKETIHNELNEIELNQLKEQTKNIEEKYNRIQQDILKILEEQTRQEEFNQSANGRINGISKEIQTEQKSREESITTIEKKQDEMTKKIHQIEKFLKSKQKKQNEFENKMNSSLTQIESRMGTSPLVLSEEDVVVSIAKYTDIVPKLKQMGLELSQMNTLETWTLRKCGDILFDSTVDSYAQGTSVLNERILGKTRLVFLIEDSDGEK